MKKLFLILTTIVMIGVVANLVFLNMKILNLNSAIPNLEGKIKALDNGFKNFNSAIPNLEGKIKALDNGFKNLKSTTDNLDMEISNIKEAIWGNLGVISTEYKEKYETEIIKKYGMLFLISNSIETLKAEIKEIKGEFVDLEKRITDLESKQ